MRRTQIELFPEDEEARCAADARRRADAARDWVLVFRNITSATDRRTSIAAIVPRHVARSCKMTEIRFDDFPGWGSSDE